MILSPGFKPFDPSQFDTYHYTTYPNVVTSMEFERILSATGPFMGHLQRPSDGTQPKKVAWLQCVGSRDINRCDHPYCSSVCCMYAVKEAVIAKEHAGGELDTAIFFMDMRTYGKDFERYYDRARDEQGVRFIRSRIHSVGEDSETHDPILEYVDENGAMQSERFDMVVLSIGLETQESLVDMAEKLEVALDADNFVETGVFNPVATSRRGIYVCGAFPGSPRISPFRSWRPAPRRATPKENLRRLGAPRSKKEATPWSGDVSQEEPRCGRSLYAIAASISAALFKIPRGG